MKLNERESKWPHLRIEDLPSEWQVYPVFGAGGMPDGVTLLMSLTKGQKKNGTQYRFVRTVRRHSTMLSARYFTERY